MAIIAVYSFRTNRLRRLIRDDATASELIARYPPKLGEAAIEVSAFSIPSAQQFLIDTNGITPVNDRYCAVRGRFVVHTFVGDIDCGDSAHSHPGTSLVIDDRAKVGWRQLNDDTLARSLTEVRALINNLERSLANLESLPVLADRSRAELDGRINVVEGKLAFLRVERDLR